MRRLGPAVILLLALSLAGCIEVTFGGGVRGSGKIASEPRDVGSFDRIELTGSPDVIVTVGGAQAITVEADDNLLEIIETEVKGSTLVISSSERFSTRSGITLRITVPELTGVSVTGSGDVSVAGLDADSFETSVTGSGDISAAGTAREVTARVTGSGDIDCSSLKAATARATITGSGDIRVHATESVRGTILGSGDILYGGNPSEVRRTVTGSGEIVAG